VRNLTFGANGAETARTVFRNREGNLARYLRRDETGALIETLDGLFERVAAAIAESACHTVSLRWLRRLFMNSRHWSPV